MKVTILGSGPSTGVPVIGCDCTVCRSPNPRNKRLRASVRVETGGKSILIDTSPDIRQQCLSNNIKSVDAILYTHAHADHTHGIDDVRSLNMAMNQTIPVYLDEKTFQSLQKRFGYAFEPLKREYGWYKPCLDKHIIDCDTDFQASGIMVTPFRQIHGTSETMGIRIGDFAYSTDVKTLPEESFKRLEGVNVWVVDCLRYDESPTHAHLAQTLEWIARVKPKRAILTHMAHEIDYETLQSQLPDGVEAGHDGMVIELFSG